MKIFIEKIDLIPIENTSFSDKELNFIYGYQEVSYVLINGHNKLNGQIRLGKTLDSIKEIEEFITKKVKEDFNSFDHEPN